MLLTPGQNRHLVPDTSKSESSQLVDGAALEYLFNPPIFEIPLRVTTTESTGRYGLRHRNDSRGQFHNSPTSLITFLAILAFLHLPFSKSRARRLDYKMTTGSDLTATFPEALRVESRSSAHSKHLLKAFPRHIMFTSAEQD